MDSIEHHTPDSVRLLVGLLDAVATGRPVDQSIRAWLLQGLEDLLHGRVGSLDEALDLLPAPGERSIATRYRTRLRNIHIALAHRLVTRDAGATPWARSLLLEQEVRKFEMRIWPRLQSNDEPPADITPLRRALFYAFSYGPPPATARRLHEIATVL